MIGRPSYQEWLERRIAERSVGLSTTKDEVRFSVLTTVYEKTDAALFLETAASLRGQSFAYAEWIILAHGPVSDALGDALAALEAGEAAKVFREPVNLGIVGGMRFCLERASGDYIIPMDADDLLTPDALEIFAAEALSRAFPAYFYSDEDHLIDGRPAAPYWRPDWDPILHLASCYIWHLVAIRRDVALALGAYTSPEAEYCHDWDTTFRVAEAGYQPVHIPEAVYHWRQHRRSISNNPDPDTGTARSTRLLCERVISRMPRSDLYEVVQFPIFRGAPEWHIARRRVDPPRVAAIGAGADNTAQGPYCARAVAMSGDAPALLAALAEVDADFALIASGSVAPSRDDDFWEAVRLFELHSEAALVQGLLLDSNNSIVRGGEILGADGKIFCPQFGKQADDAGPFAMALKPHAISAVVGDFFFAEVAFLRRALAALGEVGPAGIGERLGAVARAEGRLTAFSPLIRCAVVGPLLDALLGAAGGLAITQGVGNRSVASSAKIMSMSRLIQLSSQYG